MCEHENVIKPVPKPIKIHMKIPKRLPTVSRTVLHTQNLSAIASYRTAFTSPSMCPAWKPRPSQRNPRKLCLVLLRIHNTVFFDLWLVIAVHRRDVLEDGSGSGASEALDDVYIAGQSSLSSILRSFTAYPLALLTVLVCNDALCVNDSLLRCLNYAIRRVVWPAHNDRLLRRDSHGESGEESNGEGSKCETHPERL
jgi:hypothetical protein